jgi:hypothetical protein
VGDLGVERHWLERRKLVFVVERGPTVNVGERHADGKERGGVVLVLVKP